MTAAEEGLLLLCCPICSEEPPLTQAQYRLLRQKIRQLPPPEEPGRPLTARDLVSIGCRPELAEEILRLLSRAPELRARLDAWAAAGVLVRTRLHPDYPRALSRKLGDDAPPVLFLRGDSAILNRPAVSLVGSRDLRPENEAFARAVGRAAAAAGCALVSGNARGADRTGQESCLAAGGAVVSIVADRLLSHAPRKNLLYLSEDSPEAVFSASRALRRNRCIHALGAAVFAAQARLRTGGTWRGTLQNLAHGWTPVFVYEDGSEAAAALRAAGAQGVETPSPELFVSPVSGENH